MKSIEYQETFPVPVEAIDGLGHVNNTVYLNWVQRISQKHWERTIPENQRKDIRWVVLSHFIEYKKPAFLGEELTVKTWVEQMEGVKSERHVQISKTQTGEEVAKVKTIWCLVDAENMRPQRIPKKLGEAFFKKQTDDRSSQT